MEPDEALQRTFTYHERTKHHLNRYARSAGYLDWSNQPDPFRTYTGARRVDLPLLADAVTASYEDLYHPGSISPRRPDLNAIAILFELSLGLSAWKQYKTSRWALRCNPSSGNLHPTEGYLVTRTVPGLDGGVYHYVSRDHCLELRCTLDPGRLGTLLPADAFLVGLSSIHWREAWKYGERAFRYCQHDAGHAIAAVRYAAACLGWSATLLDDLPDATVAGILGLDDREAFDNLESQDLEHPDALLRVCPSPSIGSLSDPLPSDVLEGGCWAGKANILSPAHEDWSIIDDVSAATWKPAVATTARFIPAVRTAGAKSAARSALPAAKLIRQRRSALGFDGHTSISAERFLRMLDHLLPRLNVPPWDALPWEPHLHLALFVHRVDGLTPGLYFLERREAVHERIRRATRQTFAWQHVRGCPAHLRLYFLMAADLRQSAQLISCHQEIAADGAFSLGMIAEFADSIRTNGPWWYRRLFWESGIVGQVLYLEAEAAGTRATGIGCYFDDACHDLLGLKGDEFQSLYHFSVGGPVEDERLQTIAAYAHLERG